MLQEHCIRRKWCLRHMVRTVTVLSALLTVPPAFAKPENAETFQNPQDPAGARISFLHDVVPVLTKAGCNAGACHGSPSGKNGFRLSLRGFDTALDIRSLTRDELGRRIDRLKPDASLILLKATAQVPHGGGRRFGIDSNLYDLLRRWVAQGAIDDSAKASGLARIEITPSHGILEDPESAVSLRLVAYYRNGAKRDVTHLARYSVADESFAQVTSAGRVVKRRCGESVAIAEYMGHMATAQLVFRAHEPRLTWSNPPEQNEIDHHVFAKLRLVQIEPSPLAGDSEFLRRVYLDVIGKLPAPDEVRRFLADADREAVIDRLLDRPEFADWWAMKWSDRLGCNQRFVGKIGAVKYHEWIRQAMAENLPEDAFVRAILTAGGGNYGNPPAGYYRRLRDPESRAEETAQLFLGVRLQCARCHNHPGESWTQKDYYGLAAFFARIRYHNGPFFKQIYDKEETVYPTREGEVSFPRTRQSVLPKYLDGPVAVLQPDEDRRESLARWLTGPENPYFARAAVNRIWYHLFGRGIVEPVDDFRSTNPPSNEDLLASLTADFIHHGYDRKYLIRKILNSRTYQLSAQTLPSNGEDEKYFSHARVRLLQAEQLLDAVSSATEIPEKFPGWPRGMSAAELPDGEYKHPFLEAFGRPARAMACECERDTDTTLSQALQLAGGRVVQEKISSDSGRVARLLRSGCNNAGLVEELFLATLSRFPTADERQVLLQRLDRSGPKRRQVAEDILWALINHKEFLFQH